MFTKASRTRFQRRVRVVMQYFYAEPVPLARLE